MTRRLVDNLRTSIKESGRPARVKPVAQSALRRARAAGRARGRATPRWSTRFARVFGVQSVSLTHAAPWRSLEDVVREGDAFGEPFVRGRRFAIRARRMGERHEVKLRSARDPGAARQRAAARVSWRRPLEPRGHALRRGRRRARLLLRREGARGRRPSARDSRAARSRFSRAASIRPSRHGACSGAASPSTTSSAISAAGRTSWRRSRSRSASATSGNAGRGRASTRSTSISSPARSRRA